MSELQSNQLDERIEVHSFNPEWIDLYRIEAMALHIRLVGRVLGIEHIGSTAIPGIRAKPVVDIMVGVESYNLQTEVIDPLLRGYECLGEAGVPGRLYFRRRDHAAVNVHAVEYLGKHWVNNLLFRDYLLTHPEEAGRYGRAKDQILAKGICTLLAYSRAKQPIMEELLTNARAWGFRQTSDGGSSA